MISVFLKNKLNLTLHLINNDVLNCENLITLRCKLSENLYNHTIVKIRKNTTNVINIIK